MKNWMVLGTVFFAYAREVNLCFIAVLIKKVMAICSHDVETVIHERSFFMDFVFFVV